MRRGWLIAAGAATLILVAPAIALAGGWATVGLSSTPDGLAAGEPWTVEIEVLQHGQTPLEGVKPKLTVTEAGSGETRTATARPTERAGIYRADVTFPRAGAWAYEIDDGFTQTHSYPPARIGRSTGSAASPVLPGSGDSVGTSWARLGFALAAGLLASGLVAVAQGRRRDPGESAVVKA